MNNEQLLERYPFLKPRNVCADELIEDADWTLLDYMPSGWRKAFGEQMCEEIRAELIKYNYLDKYRIVQIKEKYGSLCWYTNGEPQSVYEIVSRYEKLSAQTCIVCGKPATLMSKHWIMPFCDCIKSKEHFNEKNYTPINK